MNKEQQKTAKELILFLKKRKGFAKAHDISNEFKGITDEYNDFAIIGGLKDFGLIDMIGKSAFRLTENGWKFKSFRKLNFEKILQIINVKILWVIAIISVLLNFYQAIIYND